MFKVTFKFGSGEDVTTFAQENENLLEVARKVNVAIDAPCGGNASCGKCRVKILEGNMDFRGRIRSAYILWLAWGIWKDRHTRRMIKRALNRRRF